MRMSYKVAKKDSFFSNTLIKRFNQSVSRFRLAVKGQNQLFKSIQIG